MIVHVRSYMHAHAGNITVALYTYAYTHVLHMHVHTYVHALYMHICAFHTYIHTCKLHIPFKINNVVLRSTQLYSPYA